jgi:hypothetical protein
MGFQLRGSGFHLQEGHTRNKEPGDLSVLYYRQPCHIARLVGDADKIFQQ